MSAAFEEAKQLGFSSNLRLRTITSSEKNPFEFPNIETSRPSTINSLSSKAIVPNQAAIVAQIKKEGSARRKIPVSPLSVKPAVNSHSLPLSNPSIQKQCNQSISSKCTSSLDSKRMFKARNMPNFKALHEKIPRLPNATTANTTGPRTIHTPSNLKASLDKENSFTNNNSFIKDSQLTRPPMKNGIESQLFIIL
jgi:hypothetical protein